MVWKLGNRFTKIAGRLVLRENHSGMETYTNLFVYISIRCVRTIVVWKQGPLKVYRNGRSQLRENHSGMETTCSLDRPHRSKRLRENHSGMETNPRENKAFSIVA